MSMPAFDIDTVPEEHRGRVAALIPDPRIADAYVHRAIEGVEDFDIFDDAVEERENVLLNGPTGSSKTTAFRAYAASRGLPFTIVECNASMDVATVLGRTTIDSEGSVVNVDGDFLLVTRFGGVVLVDEINMAHPRITAGFHQLFAVTRRISVPEFGETVIAGRGVVIGTDREGLPVYSSPSPQPTLFAAAYNERYQGVVRMNEAMRNRFAVPLDWGYERAVEEQLVESTRLLNLADAVRSLSEIRTPMSTNALMEFERHAHKRGIQFASTLLVNRFESQERGPVARALEAESAAIAKELGL